MGELVRTDVVGVGAGLPMQRSALVPPVPPGIVRVALLDDHRLFAGVLRCALDEDPRFTVVSQARVDTDGVSAAVLADATVVVVDIEAPDAFALIEQVRARLPAAAVLVLTALDDDELVRRAVDAGVSGYLTLDVGLDEVTQAIVMVAAGRTMLSGRRLQRLVQRLSSPARGSERAMSDFLTERENQVLHHLADGQSTTQMALEMGISLNTVRTHTQNVLTKLNVHSKLAAAAYAVRNGLA